MPRPEDRTADRDADSWSRTSPYTSDSELAGVRRVPRTEAREDKFSRALDGARDGRDAWEARVGGEDNDDSEGGVSPSSRSSSSPSSAAAASCSTAWGGGF